MLRRLATAALVIAWLCANGAMWDALQVVAWGKMFAGYAGTMSVTQALATTLDPAKPCELCVAIVQAKDDVNEKMPTADQSLRAKNVLALHAVEAPVFANDFGDWQRAPDVTLTERTDPVPLPPPRV